MVPRSYGKQKLMKDDPLEFIMTILGYKHKEYLRVVQVFIFIILSYLQTFNLICIMDIILNKNFAYLEYLPFVFLHQNGCFGLVMVFVYSKEIFQFQDILFSNFWSISSGGEQVKSRILRESNIIKLMCTVIYGLTVMVHLAFLPFVGDEEHLIFPVMYCAKHFGRWSAAFIFFYYLCLLISSYGVAYPVFLAAYMIFHVRFQFYLLNSDVRNLPKEDFVGIFNKKLRRHGRLYRRISVCAKHHADIKMVTKTLLRRLQNIPMMMISICGLLAFIAASCVLIFQISPSSNWRIVLTLMNIIAVFLTFCVCGQKITDESNQFLVTLYNTPWYHWNKQSKMVLGMMLMNSLKPLRVTCFGLTDLNYALVLFAVRTIYSLLTLSRKFKQPDEI